MSFGNSYTIPARTYRSVRAGIVRRGQKRTFILINLNKCCVEFRKLLYYPRPNVPFGTGGHCTTRSVKSKEPNNKRQIPKRRFLYWILFLIFCYFISPPTLLPNIFTPMASKTTPKNLRTAIKPAFPKAFSIRPNERKTK